MLQVRVFGELQSFIIAGLRRNSNLFEKAMALMESEEERYW
jgi:hypothetical protein